MAQQSVNTTDSGLAARTKINSNFTELYALPIAAPAGSTTQVQYNNAGSFGGAAKVAIDASGHLVTDEYQEYIAATTPSTPAATRLRQFVRTSAGRLFAAILGPSGQVATLQPHTGYNRVAKWQAAGGSTTITVDGMTALTATGAATLIAMSSANRYGIIRKLEYLVTVAATNAVAGFRNATSNWMRGASAGDGGFNFICQWGPATGVSVTTTQAFVGMAASTVAPTDVAPSSITNIVGMGWDSGDTNIQIMTNDASGTAVKTDLGASFPRPSVDRTSFYELALFCAPNSSTIGYTVTDMVSGATTSGTLSSDLPVNTTFLGPRGWMSVGGTSSVVGIALGQLYIESDI